MSEKETKMQSFRFSTSAVENFRAYCEENGISQAEGFESLLKTAELEKAKTAIPERKAEIENVQTHANALVAAYLHSLDIYTSAANRAQDDVAEKIAKMDTRIEALEEEKSAIKAMLCEKSERGTELEKCLADRDNQIESLSVTHKNTLNSLKDKDKIIASIEGENTRFEALTTDYERLQKTYTELTQKVADYEKRILEAVQQKENAERLLNENEKKYNDIVSQLEVQHQNALEAAKNDKEKAVLAVRSEWQQRYEEFTLSREKKLDELEKRNKEVAALKEKNRKLEQELAVFKKYDFDDEDVDVWEV